MAGCYYCLPILHSQARRRAAWGILGAAVPALLPGDGWMKEAAGRTQIRSYLHSTSLSCPQLRWLSQAQGQQPAAEDGGKDFEVRELCSSPVIPARVGGTSVKVQCLSYHFPTAFLMPRFLLLNIAFSPRDKSMK